jgi:hypothetical protein
MLQCSTEIVSLVDQPAYEALSYVWGDAAIRQNILFDGDLFSVTENLAVALYHLRLPDNPRRLWVDALCINQSNTKERNEQVELMGEIYASASPVLIWLGEASEGSDDAFALMSQIADGKEVAENDSRELFSFCIELVERTWFTRLWTVQEMVLANQDPLVACGFSWTSWSVLFGGWQKVALNEFSKMEMVIWEDAVKDESKSEEKLGVRPGAIKIDLLNNLRAAITSNGGEEFRDLLLNTNSSNATEPRDRIYALLGMMKKENREDFRVDYDRPLEIVYGEAMAHVFRKGNGPFLLSGMASVGRSPDSSLPSWVPAFGSKSLLSPLRLHPAGVGASGAGSDCQNGIVDPDYKTLRVRGLPVDTVIDKVSFGEGNDCLTRLDEVETLVSKARQLAQQNSNHRPYLNSFKCKEPVWRTLIANKAYSGAAREFAPESYGEMYALLLRRQFPSGPGQEETDEFVRDYRLSLLNCLPSGCFFITATGFFGISHAFGTLEKGDQLAIWFGSPVPFVLRPVHEPDNGHSDLVYAIHGVAYVAGIMEGEMVDEVYCEDLEDDIVFTVQ